MATRATLPQKDEFESFEVILDPLKVENLSAGTLARMHAITRLDRPLAYVSTIAPAVGFVAAVTLLFMGYGSMVDFWLLVVMFFLSQTGIVVGYHRLFTHRSFKAKKSVEVVLAALGSMAFQGPVIWWAATHRRHHGISDQEGDPHSPNLFGDGFWGKLRGFFHAHMGWLFIEDSMRPPGWMRYVRDLYANEGVLKVHMNYFFWLGLGFLIPAVLGGLLTWSWMGVLLGFLWGGLARVFLTIHAIWCVNSVCHLFGSRPFEIKHDHSRNNFWRAIPTLGEAWHNNHHAFPSSAIIGLKWWQMDPSGWVIRGLEKLGLVWDVRVPTAAMIEKQEKRSAAIRQQQQQQTPEPSTAEVAEVAEAPQVAEVS